MAEEVICSSMKKVKPGDVPSSSVRVWERQLPGDGTLAVVFTCPSCSHEVAMLTNPMETQLVSGLGIKIGGRTVPEQPMELTRSELTEPREDAFVDQEGPEAAAGPVDREDGGQLYAEASEGGRVQWSEDSIQRLGQVPRFVRGMVKRIYTDWAKESGIPLITPEVMDRARTELGLEDM